MFDIKTNTEKLLQFVAAKFQDGELDNDSLVQLIELAGQFLNLQTIPVYAVSNNLSYNGVKNYRTTVELFNVKFVIDNN